MNRVGKIVLIGDTHFGAHTSSRKMFDRMMEYFTTHVFPYLIDNKIKHVISAGDLFDNRSFTDNYILFNFNKIFVDFFETNEINFYSLVGNHDIVFKNSRTPNIQESLFDGCNFCHAIPNEEIREIDNFKVQFTPWVIDEDRDFHDYSRNVDFLIGHFDITGMIMEGSITSRHGFDPSLFNKYKHVFSGHYHSKSKYRNIEYLGTPYQLKWSQHLTKTGFYTITKERENIVTEFIENTISPKYVKLYYSEDLDTNDLMISSIGLSEDFDSEKYKNDILNQDIIDIISNNVVKVIIKDYISNTSLENFLTEIQKHVNYGKLAIINESDYIDVSQCSEEEVTDSYEMNTLISQRISQMKMPEMIDQEKIKNYFIQLYEKSSTITDTI